MTGLILPLLSDWLRVLQPSGRTCRGLAEPSVFENRRFRPRCAARLVLRCREPTRPGAEWVWAGGGLPRETADLDRNNPLETRCCRVSVRGQRVGSGEVGDLFPRLVTPHPCPLQRGNVGVTSSEWRDVPPHAWHLGSERITPSPPHPGSSTVWRVEGALYGLGLAGSPPAGHVLWRDPAGNGLCAVKSLLLHLLRPSWAASEADPWHGPALWLLVSLPRRARRQAPFRAAAGCWRGCPQPRRGAYPWEAGVPEAASSWLTAQFKPRPRPFCAGRL